MSTSATNNNNQVAAIELPVNPFSDWKSTVDLDPNNTVVSNLPNDVATLILSYLPFEQVQTVMESTETKMGRLDAHVYRSLMGDAYSGARYNEHCSSLNGKELTKFQRLLSLEKGEDLIDGQPPVLKSWASLMEETEKNAMSLTGLKELDLSDSTVTEADLFALTKSSPNLTKLVLPGAFPSDEVMAVLRTHCPRAAIYPSAMTEQEWSHPAEFMAKLPPPPKEVADFINGRLPIWGGKTAAEAHMVMPKVNKIVRNIDGNSVIVPWTLANVNELDKATGGLGCHLIQGHLPKPDASNVGFEWVVLTKEILPGSRGQEYMVQPGARDVVEEYGYEVPGIIDATTCMLWENRLTGTRIYSDDPYIQILCKETWHQFRLVAGAFDQQGVFVGISHAKPLIGVAGIRKFNVVRDLNA